MKRKQYIDILKVIGLLGIILAHVTPPAVVFQLRNFDDFGFSLFRVEI